MTIRLKSSAEVAPNFTLGKINVVEGGSSSSSTYGGAQVQTITAGSAHWDYSVNLATNQAVTAESPSGDTDVSDFPILRRSTGFSGTATAILRRGNFNRTVTLDFSDRAGESTKSTTGLAAGASYLRYSHDWLVSLLAGEGSMDVFVEGNRNTDCWAAGEDLTGIPFSTSAGAQKCGALITRRHLVGVRHYMLSVGDSVTFRNAANVSYTYTIVGRSAGGGIVGDAVVYTLSSDVHASIADYPVAGRWLHVTDSSGVSHTTRRQLVGVFINQDRRASFVQWANYEATSEHKFSGLVGDMTVNNAVVTAAFQSIFSTQQLPELVEFSGYSIGARAGDSGAAVFVPVDGGIALAATMTSPQSGPFFDEAFANALIVSADSDAGVSTGYTITVAPDPTA